METGGEGGGGEAERRGGSELGRLLEAIESSEILEKRISLVKQPEEFSADDLGLILQGLLASWIDSTCSGVSHCRLHRSILQVALKCSDLDITSYLGQFLTLGAKASSWCEKHLHWFVKSNNQSGVIQEEEHNRLHLEINSLSFSISTKLLGIAAKCITVQGLEVAVGEGGKGAAEQECVLNKADDEFLTLKTMAVEVEHLAVGRRTKAVRRKAPWSLTPVLSPPPQEPERRWCMQCGREKRPQRRPGPDGPSTLCNACRYPLKNSASAAAVSSKNTLLLRSNSHRRQGRPSKKRHRSSRENSAPGNNVGGSLDAFFDHTGLEEAWKPERAEKLERLSNKGAFQSVETMAVEVEETPTLGAPRARTKRRRRVTATETTSRQANVPLHGDLRAEKKAVRRCTHCATEKTPQWRVGPEGPGTLCNACGMVFKKGGLLPEYRPVNSPAFSPLLHSNTHRRALKMHRQNGTTSACHGEAHSELMEGHLLPPANGPASFFPLQQRHSPLRQGRLQIEEATSAAGHATAEACRGEECVEVQLLPERPPVDRPSVALVYRRRVACVRVAA